TKKVPAWPKTAVQGPFYILLPVWVIVAGCGKKRGAALLEYMHRAALECMIFTGGVTYGKEFCGFWSGQHAAAGAGTGRRSAGAPGTDRGGAAAALWAAGGAGRGPGHAVWAAESLCPGPGAGAGGGLLCGL